MIPTFAPRQIPAPTDVQPEGPGEIEHTSDAIQPTHSASTLDKPIESVDASTNLPNPTLPAIYRTTPNSFGLIREYQVSPNSPLSAIPELQTSSEPDPSTTVPPELSAVAELSYAERVRQIIAPLANLSIFRLAHWFYTHDNTNSQKSTDALISSVISDDNFDPAELKGVTMRSINQKLDSIGLANSGSGVSQQLSDNWQAEDITIRIPTGKSTDSHPSATSLHDKGSAELFGEPFSVSGLEYRPLLSVLKSRFSDPIRSKYFVYKPYKQFFKHADGTEERVFDNLYTTDAWLEEHERIQKLDIRTESGEPCMLERAIAATMVGSDATTVTDFSQKSVWEVYGYFGNEPKWFRRKPGARASEHLAHLPKLPANIKDFIAEIHGKAAQAPLLAHCRRELFHECWKHMLDDEFIHAYHNGIVVKCGDGVTRRLFPRFITYSADYPERQVLYLCRLHAHIPDQLTITEH
ncbi:hypothetical protein FRC12_019950 [Ceratobasidium sp. 428]|nr:hypothetical protein FRC12_019950 [Ceratobasidium sp. 428]